jgi:hypothetical protein
MARKWNMKVKNGFSEARYITNAEKCKTVKAAMF